MKEETILASVLVELKNHANTKNLGKMAKFGINFQKGFGVRIPILREIAKKYKNDHFLASLLWDSGFHEARILASLIDNPKFVTVKQMEAWVIDFNSWDICDHCCANLFEDTPFSYNIALEWSKRNEEYVKRAGFVLMARLAISDKKADDALFKPFLKRMFEEATDERNFVKKAVNWALRQTGKRSMIMNKAALNMAGEMLKLNSKSAKWIANDAIRELTNPKTTNRIKH